MKKTAYFIGVTALLSAASARTDAQTLTIRSYGEYRQMIRLKKTEGAVHLRNAIAPQHAYAVGALQKGVGEITVIDGEAWLDYGSDGIGNAKRVIPADEQAVLLVTAQVAGWQTVTIDRPLSKEALFETILEKAEERNLDTAKPFPFLLEGNFSALSIHVINGRDPAFVKPGGKTKLYRQLREKRTHQNAAVVGFYSARSQGIYTHPGESWHLHALIKEEKIGAHVDDIVSEANITLKLPLDNR